MNRKKLNYKRLIFANALLVCLYLFIAIQLSYDFIEQFLFACIFALVTIGFNLFITEGI
jgi:hypothetical protein